MIYTHTHTHTYIYIYIYSFDLVCYSFSVKLQENLVSEHILLLNQKRLVISAERKVNEVSQDTHFTIYLRQR